MPVLRASQKRLRVEYLGDPLHRLAEVHERREDPGALLLEPDVERRRRGREAHVGILRIGTFEVDGDHVTLRRRYERDDFSALTEGSPRGRELIDACHEGLSRE